MAVWHNDPALQGRFHDDYPDDVQMLIHNGSFRFTTSAPEVVWVRITARMEFERNDGKQATAYKALLLNQPHHLEGFEKGADVLLLADADYEYAIYATHEYVLQRPDFEITPCDNCGLPELFDTVPSLIDFSFEGEAATQMQKQIEAGGGVVFSSFCPMCGKAGQLTVKSNPA